MDSNQLIKHVEELNKLERQEHERKRLIALNKIRELRLRMKREENARIKRDVVPQ